MMLSDHQIEHQVLVGGIRIYPFEFSYLQPASIDLRLGREFIRYEDTFGDMPLDPFLGDYPTTKTIMDETLIRPGEFILATTLEAVSLSPKYSAQVNGKSTLGRLGLVVHATAGFVDPGFDGTLTLELTNLNKHSIVLRAGMKIAQLHFFEMSQAPRLPYGSKERGSHYQGQRGVTGPETLS